MSLRLLFALSLFLTFQIITLSAQTIPLPEHPRPDFEREDWINLNGAWAFAFDAENVGMSQNWQNGKKRYPLNIQVPFPWGSELSGVSDDADIAWYKKAIKVPATWKSKRTFVTIGASDWETTVWLDGKMIGRHEGGYVPFSFELTPHLNYGKAQNLVIRVDDARRDFTLYGKQGYGNARGIWQTIYLEARGQNYLEAVHFSPDIDKERVKVEAYLEQATAKEMTLQLAIETPNGTLKKEAKIPEGKSKHIFYVDLPSPRLWDLDDPYLYMAKATVGDDVVNTYFGMRKISVMNLPNTKIPYIALNNEPIYLQLALDQSYHPKGFYTFPSDQFLQEEIMRSKSIGLNGIRTHIKVEVPRKLYWADKTGLLVMEDLPNSWGEPDQKMRDESTYTLQEMIKRDYNHPSIFSWIVFNETWGLFSSVPDPETGETKRSYLPETQQWVASMYYLAKSLDPTRLVEDNSICCGRGHTETDIYSWHAYLPGWAWDDYLQNLTAKNYSGSSFDFEEGFTQGNQPSINSECGNVWGYIGSTGDVDWSWDYHRMMNSFREYPKVSGWLYTEHHDVINEWNGYWRFDRSEKETGMGDFVEGMTLNDLHAPVYLSLGNEISKTVKGNSETTIPFFLSSMSPEDHGDSLMVSYQLRHMDYLGEAHNLQKGEFKFAYQPYLQKQLNPLRLIMPSTSGVATLAVQLSDTKGEVLMRNFMNFEVIGRGLVKNVDVSVVGANTIHASDWSKKQWTVMDGKKVNGTGKGYFEYRIPVTQTMVEGAASAEFLIEVSAKELFVKDQIEFDDNQDYMKGSRVYPSSNPNSYPMSDETMFPSEVAISFDGKLAATVTLPDDPADHRGVLSWHNQLKDRRLREAGSYGYLQRIPVDLSTLAAAAEKGYLSIRLETKGEGGIAVYGADFGRYAVPPSLVIKRR
ncbi:MAG: sugar-binding domain-containing protein [Bacteroidota bacterium]